MSKSEIEHRKSEIEEMLIASEQGYALKVRELLDADAALANAKGAYDKTPLHLAAEKDHREVADMLVDAGADITSETTWGMTPLEWAATMGSRDVAGRLIAEGAAPNLYVAAGLGMLDRVRELFGEDRSLRHDVPQLRCIDRIEGTYVRTTAPEDDRGVIDHALYIAARNGHDDVVALLLEKGADVDARGFFGGTGLHWAAINGHASTVAFLLEKGADPTLKDERWSTTPREYAREGGRSEIEHLLLEREGAPGEP